MTKKLTGQPALPYLGVNAPQPPNIIREPRRPTPNDCQNFNLGDLWLYHVDTPPQVDELWLYIRRYPNRQALWIRLWPNAAAGAMFGLHAEAGDALPDGLGFVNVFGGDNLGTAWQNMNTDGDNVNTLHVSLNTSIWQPSTTADELKGVYGLNGIRFVHAYGTHNTFIGEASGNYTLDIPNAINNTGLGFQSLVSLRLGSNNLAAGDSSLNALDDGVENCAVGHYAMRMATDSSWCVAVGKEALGQCLHGSTITALGFQAAFNYNNIESNDIIIGNPGIATENNTIRIGIPYVDPVNWPTWTVHTACYVGGIYHANIAGTAGVVFCDNTGKLGTGADPANGSVLIGGSNGPQWQFLTAGPGVVIANGDHAITISAGGGPGGGLTTAHTDGGVGHDAVIDAFNAITWAGDGIIETDGALNTVTISLPGTAVNGELLTSDGAGNTVWSSLVSGGGTVIITTPAPGTINLEAAAGGGITLTSDNATTANGANINVIGVEATLTNNIYTRGDNAATMTIFLKNAIILPPTNAAGTSGILAIGNVSPANDYFLHALGTRNTFVGSAAGNLTLTVLNATDNTGIGSQSLQSITLGSENTCCGGSSGSAITQGQKNSSLGQESLEHVTTGSGNSSLGFQSLNGIVAGNLNLGLGYQSGSALTAADSSNVALANVGVGGISNTMWLGTDGVGVGAQNAVYLAGSYARTANNNKQFVFQSDDFKLGTYSFVSGDGSVTLNFVGGTVDIRAVGGGGGAITQVQGGANINTVNPAGPIVTVNLNTSVWQPHANAAMTTGVYGLGGNPWIHDYGSTFNTFVGALAGNFTLAGAVYNTGIGYTSLYHLVDGDQNACLAAYSGNGITSGSRNTYLGHAAGYTNNVALECVGVGYHALYSSAQVTIPGNIPNYNTAVGSDSLSQLVQGERNTCLGRKSGYNYVGAEANNIVIGYNVFGTAGDNNVIRIGDTVTGIGGTYVSGIYDYIQNGYPAAFPVTVNAAGRLGRATDLTLNGLTLSNLGPGVVYVDALHVLRTPVDFRSTNNTIIIDDNVAHPSYVDFTIYESTFLAKLVPDSGNVTGDGTEYWLGLNQPLTIECNLGPAGQLTNTGAVPFRFNCKAQGVYQFNVQFGIRYNAGVVPIPVPTPPAPCHVSCPIYIRVYTAAGALKKSYRLVDATFGTLQTESRVFTANIGLLLNEYVQFSIAITRGDGQMRDEVMGESGGYVNTWVSGDWVSLMP